MWTLEGKQISSAINLEKIYLLRFSDGTQSQNFKTIKSFNRGIFVNPSLDKKWKKISKPRRGVRLIAQKKFPLKQMLSFLSQRYERLFQVVENIYIPYLCVG